MPTTTELVQSFPFVSVPSQSGGLAVEVSLIAQLMHGSGNHVFVSAVARQRQHGEFIDQLDEPSAKLGGTNFDKGDSTSLYSFAVGPRGHPFHCHAGHRIFTAISGSGGAQLRFSSASMGQIEQDPYNFIRALHYVNIPPDCVFSVRFGGQTWHQFAPLSQRSNHPAFFALSCHTNELGGELPADLKQLVLANKASIPSLTTLLPDSVLDLLDEALLQTSVPTVDLALEAPPRTLRRALFGSARASAGIVLGIWARWHNTAGFVARQARRSNVVELDNTPPGSLLLKQFSGEQFHYEDTFSLTMDQAAFEEHTATALLSAILDGFLSKPPAGVARLMVFRNFLVRPLGLRTSPLGCPVSSLLSQDQSQLFANRFPVLEQATDNRHRRAQVLLGANDKHLVFRSCVCVTMLPLGRVQFTLGTRVKCKNAFGRVYMAAITRVHRTYVTPTMLSRAVDHATLNASQTEAQAQVV